MAELLSAIEENREPSNNARDNLLSLALAFAAIESSHTGAARPVGAVRTLRDRDSRQQPGSRLHRD